MILPAQHEKLPFDVNNDMSPKPTTLLPKLPVATTTVPGFTSIGWQALTVRRGTPEPIVLMLGDSPRKVLHDPELQEQLRSRWQSGGRRYAAYRVIGVNPPS